MAISNFEWDESKDLDNQLKHGVSLLEIQSFALPENDQGTAG
jgi:uncharacterized DUF497 family protein